MNSLNILSTVAPPLSASATTPTSSVGPAKENERSPRHPVGQAAPYPPEKQNTVASQRQGSHTRTSLDDGSMEVVDEQSPLLGESRPDHFGDVKPTAWRSLPKRISTAVVGSVRIVIATISAPCRYVIACFYDEQGRFSPLRPFVTIYHVVRPRRKKKRGAVAMLEKADAERGGKYPAQKRPKRPPSMASSSTAVASDSEMDEKVEAFEAEPQHSKSARSLSLPSASTEDAPPSRRSIRIKLHNDELLKRQRQSHSASASESASKEDVTEAVAASLKSPPSPGVLKLTKFPRTPAPPRPLIPRRLPSYKNVSAIGPHQKTLIIDLDETLIHSHSKGGRFATGHMVEVRMQHAVGIGGTFIGPQIPILYYVHKRPHCDEFLKKVSKWFNLVIFTASVQEYADPVIDWLELERSYFSGRYYRQHCTHRNGAYIKDLSQVEPDLSKVMIVDNSPVSYVFHEDNAIPIEGWISDPTDNDLLNLIPLLEGLQHATDVRALLALRMGQPQDAFEAS